MWGRLVWFAQVKYTIGGLSFSTLDMEHGVLRGNAPSPAAIPVLLGQPQLAKPYFSQDDPRIKLVRLGLCGSPSCRVPMWYQGTRWSSGLLGPCCWSASATFFFDHRACTWAELRCSPFLMRDLRESANPP